MVIQGKAHWCSIQAPNDKFPPPAYMVDLSVSEEDADMLRGKGINIKEKDGQGLCFKAKRNQFRKDGTLNTKPNCVDVYKKPFDDLIGNGSLVNLQINIFDWEFGGKTGTSADFVGIQVLDLVEFSGSNDEFKAAEAPANEDKEYDEEF